MVCPLPKCSLVIFLLYQYFSKPCEIFNQSGSTVVVEEGIFTVTSTVSSASAAASGPGSSRSASGSAAAVFVPTPRYGSGLAVNKGLLYLYGGVFEDKDERQITFNDFYFIGEYQGFLTSRSTLEYQLGDYKP